MASRNKNLLVFLVVLTGAYLFYRMTRNSAIHKRINQSFRRKIGASNGEGFDRIKEMLTKTDVEPQADQKKAEVPNEFSLPIEKIEFEIILERPTIGGNIKMGENAVENSRDLLEKFAIRSHIAKSIIVKPDLEIELHETSITPESSQVITGTLDIVPTRTVDSEISDGFEPVIAQLDTGYTSYNKITANKDPYAFLQSGYFHFDCPPQMTLGRSEKVRASIFRSELIYESKEVKETIEKILVSNSMSVKLQGESFEIVQENSTFQLISNYDETVWRWNVTPIKHGAKILSLVVTLKIKVDGSDEYKDYEIIDREILIAVDRAYMTKKWIGKNWQWVVSTIAGTGVVFSILKAFEVIK